MDKYDDEHDDDSSDLSFIRKAFQTLTQSSSEEVQEQANPAIPPTVDNLLAIYQNYQETHAFKPGDLITWKPFLRNRRYPRNGEPAVVVKVVDEQIETKHHSGSLYWKENCNIRVAVIQEDGQVILYWVPEDLMQPWKAGSKHSKHSTHEH